MDEASQVYSADAAQLRQHLLAARARTLALADDWQAALGDAHPGVPYAQERNPPLWELGHVAWFQEWWIARNRQRAAGVRCDPEHARPASLLPQADAWYDSSRVAHRLRWELALPDAAGTRDYLARTLAQTLELLDALPAHASDDELYFYRLVVLHEMMHAEASAYMGQGLGLPLRELQALAPQPAASGLQLPAQRFVLGSSDAGFAFDNELGAHEVQVAATRIDAQAVTWSRFLPFVEAGGYERQEYWSEAGREWLRGQAVRQPLYLRHGGAGWEQRVGASWQPLIGDRPAVHLGAHEAEAWCRWAGRVLPTEAQWECAALTLPGFSWGQVWEWTASRFEPYPGFAAHPYRDYSAPWFGSRRVLRGACSATAPGLARPRYRNFFEPARRDIFAGFRSCAA